MSSFQTLLTLDYWKPNIDSNQTIYTSEYDNISGFFYFLEIGIAYVIKI